MSEADFFAVDNVKRLRRAIEPYIVTTPIHAWRCAETEARLGAQTELVLKLELLQRTGTFKPRGALSVLQQLDADALRRGITAVSAGNHAIAAAYAARVFQTSAKVYMLPSANPARVDRCRRLGGDVTIAPDAKTAFEWAEQTASREGRHFVHPFDGPWTALGTATLGVELVEQLGELDAVVIPIGGGGLFAGVATAVRRMRPNCRIYGVEPEGADNMRRSLAVGAPVRMEKVSTIADSLGPPYSLQYSFELCRAAIDDLVLVSDDALRRAMDLLFREMRLAVEPAAAASTAAALSPLADRLRGRRVALVLSGTNIDLDTYTAIVQPVRRGPPL